MPNPYLMHILPTIISSISDPYFRHIGTSFYLYALQYLTFISPISSTSFTHNLPTSHTYLTHIVLMLYPFLNNINLTNINHI